LEASALTHASRRGLLARRSPLLKLQGDAKLIAMARGGNPGAFEAIVDRYQPRLLGFCRQMLGSTEDAEDVLQEVFVNAYKAMLADEREINLRPWLYRIARNRCLNHLRKPTADAQESMDMVPEVDAASTAEKVHNREEFRQLLTDVKKLPETQRSALLLREMDALSYEEIAAAMDTTVPSVKSLLVRARISLAEASQARLLTCGEVRVELSEAAEGLRKVSGPVRRHVRECDECSAFRSQVRSNDKALAALAPIGPLVALKGFIASKLGLGGGASAGASATGGAGAAGAAGAGAAGAGAAGAGAVGAAGAALSGGGAASGIGALGGALGTKAVASVVTAAVLTAGAVEVKQNVAGPVDPTAAKVSTQNLPAALPAPAIAKAEVSPATVAPATAEEAEPPAPETGEVAPPAASTATTPEEEAAPPVEPAISDAAGQSVAEPTGGVGAVATEGVTAATPSTPPPVPGAHGGSTVVVTVGAPPPATPASPPATTPPAAEPEPEPAPAEPEPAPPASEGTTPGTSVEAEPAPEVEPAP
jgi:RNA polymerase sigma factor (sigma-70 family)